jgi:transposase
VATPFDQLPDDIETLKATVLAERDARLKAEADAALAVARVSSAEAMIEHLKLLIAKLKRDRFGPSSERSRKVLDQLELQLEDLETSAAEDERAAVVAAAKAGQDATVVQGFTRRKPVRGRCPTICRASAW